MFLQYLAPAKLVYKILRPTLKKLTKSSDNSVDDEIIRILDGAFKVL